MIPIGLYMRIGAIVAAMIAALWITNVVRSAGRLRAELEVMTAQQEALVQRSVALTAAVNQKVHAERVMKSEFSQIKKLAQETPNACDSEPLSATYIEQLRKAAAIASMRDADRVATSDASPANTDDHR